MFTESELKVLNQINRGNSTVEGIADALKLTKRQTYRLVKSLTDKETIRKKEGNIVLEKKTHITFLVKVLEASEIFCKILSDSGLDILGELNEERTMKELTQCLGIHQSTVSRKLSQMTVLSMVHKQGTRYFINPHRRELIDLSDSYRAYKKTNDSRIPAGSEVYHNSKDLIVFSNNNVLNMKTTAFSKYDQYGITFYPGTVYYCNKKEDPTLTEIFLHSLYVLETADSWRLNMMALILYVKFRKELCDVSNSIKNDMDAVLLGENINGWVPLKEMQERAEMYGVNLYDS